MVIPPRRDEVWLVALDPTQAPRFRKPAHVRSFHPMRPTHICALSSWLL